MQPTKWQTKAQKLQFNLSTLIITALITLGGGLLIGLNWKKITQNYLPYLGIKQSSSVDWSDLDQVYHELKRNYNGELEINQLITGAKKGLVESLGDPHTIYMSKSEAATFNKHLHGDVGAGVGIEMGVRGGAAKVLRTLPGNPARKAGVLAGDIIYKVDGESVLELNVDKIAEKVRGPAGTKVKLTTLRDKTEHHFELVREKINNVSAYVNYDGKTAIITITRFDTDTVGIVKSSVRDFNSKGINKVILDLRNNGGGYVNAATELLSLWVSDQPVLIQKSLRHDNQTLHSNVSDTPLADIRTVVLINGASASASEIVAGALKDHKKATLIGEKSYGKGSMQSLIKLDGELLKVTIAAWYTPNGTIINKVGINPDQVVERSFEDINAERDPQLDAAKAF